MRTIPKYTIKRVQKRRITCATIIFVRKYFKVRLPGRTGFFKVFI